MRRHTAARADRFSAALARFLTTCAVLLAVLGLGAFILHQPLPAWQWAFTLPDIAVLAVLGVIRTLTPRRDPRIYGG